MHERTGLTESQTERAAWTVADRVSVGGPKAVGLFFAIAWNTRLPLLVWRVPGVSWVLDRIYESIARNRHRFPGQTPWCIDHPEACEPSPE